MLSFLKAVWYFVAHPFAVVKLTVVRRYVDAQGNYIGELYKDGRMIGASCDNWPLDVDMHRLIASPKLCWRYSFLEPLPQYTIRVGGIEPGTNTLVQAHIAERRFCDIKITVVNRFVEHVLERKAALRELSDYDQELGI
jgi:hypothetical protein